MASLNVILLSILIISFIRFKRLLRRDFNSIHNKIHVFASSIAGVGKRLVNVENHFADVATAHQEMSQFATVNSKKTYYDQAVKMIELGADMQEIIHTCHLSEAEVEMLYRMHKS